MNAHKVCARALLTLLVGLPVQANATGDPVAGGGDFQ
jgi:hypothetical protein